ncbi:MAG: LysR family transcriptional regulator [Anderseniella sp.]|jgi:DNA-binding transcriptional LysR family regulator|nr:LysR family transcriptional regulator [Anderseniella sp.]
MRVSIKAFRYFLSAASHGSIARAAEEMNVVPSAISSAIEQVESEFDLKLVHRSPAKGITPTAAGIKLMKRVQHLVDEYDSLMRDGAELRTSLSGSLSIGYYAPVAPAFVPAIAAPIMRDNPHVSMSFIACDNDRAQSGLLAGEFDLIVFVAANVLSGIEYEELLTTPPYLLVSAEHRFASGKPVRLSDLHNEPLVLLDLPFTSQYLRGLLEEAGITPRIAATASTTEMVRSLVGVGIGISILNMRPLTDVSYAGDKLLAVPLAGSATPLRLVLGHLGGSQRRLAETFAKACREYFACNAANQLIVSLGKLRQ